MSEREEQYGSSLQEVYEQYKGMDRILSDREWWGTSPQGKIICDLWQAIKGEEATPQPKWSGQSLSQPLPSPGGGPVTPRLKDLLLRLLDKRELQGITTYGRSLETWNDRDAHRDLMEELVDACQYAMQAEMERRDLVRWLGDALELARKAVHALSRADESTHGPIYASFTVLLIALQEKAAKALNQKGD